MKQEHLKIVLLTEGGSIKRTKTYCDAVKETIQYYSIDHSTLQDLLAVIIGRKATPALCQQLASLSMKELTEKSAKDFKTEFGLSASVSLSLVAAIGLAKKIANQTGMEEKIAIRSPEDVSKLMMPKMRHLTQEHFVTLFLDTKNQVIGEETIFIGSLNASIVHPREVVRP